MFKEYMNRPIIFTDNNLTKLVKQYKYKFTPGDIVAGTIFNIEKKGTLVDIGTTKLAYMPEKKIFTRLGAKNKSLTSLQINEVHEFHIVAENRNIEQYILSIKKIQQIRGWQRIKQLANENLIIHAQPVKINKGGMIVYIEGIKGFIPNSHMPAYTKKNTLLSKVLPLKILEISQLEKKFILSCKNALICQLRKHLKKGNSLLGRIKKIKSYGLLIEVQGVIGLLHISEIKDFSSLSLTQRFQINQSIEVYFLHIDSKEGKLLLSTKKV
uniref:Ribosomal protein S1-like protein n=1 Tax=Sciadococcus taiwanensis TaxID=3028030 RepID=A0A9Y1I1Z0_9RHOD|nr:ribosomal protein S1-like protein [Sciadococcus taiwanensis]